MPRRPLAKLSAVASTMALVLAPALAHADPGPHTTEARLRELCTDPASRGEPRAAGCEQLAYDAAISSAADRELGKAMRTQMMLVSWAPRGSPLAALASRALGDEWLELGEVERAAEWYERYATLDARAAGVQALGSAARLRLVLGQSLEATKDVASALERAQGTAVAAAAEVALVLVQHRVDREEWAAALESSPPSSLVDVASPDVQVKAHVLAGRAYAALGKDAEAAREYGRVRDLWRDPAASVARVKAAFPDENERQQNRRLAGAITGVGEAYFDAAERGRKASAASLRAPVYAGAPSDAKAAVAFVEGPLRAWFERRQAALRDTEPAYVAILDIQPVPPPRWITAASATVALAWGSLVDEPRRIPVPAAWARPPNRAVREAYFRAIDAMVEPVRTSHAKPAVRKCVDLSVRYQYQDTRTPECEAWLGVHYRDEVHPLDELVPALRYEVPRPAAPPQAHP